MRLRRNSRHGTALYQYDDAAGEILPLASRVHHFADMIATGPRDSDA